MKKVEAIVKPSKLKAIQKGLIDANIPCMTVVPVRGAGLQPRLFRDLSGYRKVINPVAKNHDHLCGQR